MKRRLLPLVAVCLTLACADQPFSDGSLAGPEAPSVLLPHSESITMGMFANADLTAAGTIESTSGGIKFPDGTTQSTAFQGTDKLCAAGLFLTGFDSVGDLVCDDEPAGAALLPGSQASPLPSPTAGTKVARSVHHVAGSPDRATISAPGLFANGDLTTAGTIESTSGGFKFPDGTTQTSAFGAADMVCSAWLFVMGFDSVGEIVCADPPFGAEPLTGVAASSMPFQVGGTDLARAPVAPGKARTARTYAGWINANGDLTAAGTIESQSGGFIFPDATTQTTAFMSANTTCPAGLFVIGFDAVGGILCADPDNDDPVASPLNGTWVISPQAQISCDGTVPILGLPTDVTVEFTLSSIDLSVFGGHPLLLQVVAPFAATVTAAFIGTLPLPVPALDETFELAPAFDPANPVGLTVNGSYQASQLTVNLGVFGSVTVDVLITYDVEVVSTSEVTGSIDLTITGDVDCSDSGDYTATPEV